MNMNIAQPESAAESLCRLGGAGMAVIGALTLYGLYATDIPSNWLSNLGVSVSDNSFRTLSLTGFGALIIGIALFARKGLYLIVVGLIAALAIHGHGKWYTLGNNVTSVTTPATPAAHSKAAQSGGFIDTGVALTAQQKAWCDQDEDGDGQHNRYESTLATKNCNSGTIHRVAQ